MKVKKLSLFFLLIFIATAVFSYETYVPGMKQLDDLNTLYTMAGMVFPTASFPVDKAELYKYASVLRQKNIDADIRRRIDIYLLSLAYTPEESEITAEESIAYEHYFRGNGEYSDDYDFYRSYVEMAPVLALSLSGGTDGKTGINITYEIVRQNDPHLYPTSNFFTGSEGNPVAIETYYIKTGYFTHRSGNIMLQLGRTPVHFGESGFSSMLPSIRLPYMDAFYYTWQMGPLKMTSFVSSLYNRAGGSEIADMTAANLPNIKVLGDGIIEYDADHSIAFDSTMILSSMHRFEWAFPQIRLGITALQIVSRENNSFHIGDIFPVFSWHNSFVGVHNNSLVLEAGMVPYKGLEIFAQAGFDDINSGDISGVGDTSTPTIPSYIIGSKYTHFVGEASVEYLLEGGYTHYLWGNFHEFNPDLGNYLSRAIYRYLRDEETVLLPLTSPFGPGTIWFRGNVNADLTPQWSVGFEGETIFKKTGANLVSTPYETSDELENAGFETWGYYAININYSNRLTRNSLFSIYVKPAILFRDDNMWLEFSIGGSIDISNRSVIDD